MREPSLYDASFEHDACGFGFVCDIRGRASHGIVRDALTVLVNLEHRGASGSEKNSGDGAGLTVQLPRPFLRRAAAEAGIRLPRDGAYGAGMLFLPRDPASRDACERIVEQTAAGEGLEILGWRDVPTVQRPPRGDRQGEPARDPPGLRGPPCPCRRRPRVRAPAVRGPPARREGRLAIRRSPAAPTSTCRRSAPGRSSTRGCSTPPSCCTSTRTWTTPASRAPSPWSIRASRPTRSRRGAGPTRTATSRTTARSTRCAATSTGSVPGSRCSARRCSATTCARSCRRSTRTGPTRRCSTTSWSCCTSPAGRSRTR